MPIKRPFLNSLKKRIIFFTAIIAVIPVLGFFIFFLDNTTKTLNSNLIKEHEEKISNLANYLNMEIYAAQMYSQSLLNDYQITKGLSYDYKNNLLQKSTYYVNVEHKLFSTSNIEYTLYYSNPTLFEYKDFRSIDRLSTDIPEFKEMDFQINPSQWVLNFDKESPGSITLLQKFYLAEPFQSYLKTEIPISNIQKIFIKSFSYSNTNVFYRDITGNTFILQEDLANEKPKDIFTLTHSLTNGHLIVMQGVRISLINSDTGSYLMLFAIFILSVTLIIFFIILAIHKLTSSLEAFIHILNSNDSTRLMDIEIIGNDEIAIIKRNFLQLLENNNTLHVRNLLSLEKQKALEMDLMQNKLNPHLLYNSLSVIKWKAIGIGDHDTTKLVEYMTKYYRAVLSKGKNIITFREELELIQDYIFINCFAHNAHYRLYLNVEESIYPKLIMKLILQPFVENAILHGLNGIEHDKNIQIDAYYQKSDILVQITDNGYGISTSVLQQLNLHKYQHKIGGYGIHNIVDRLQTSYGSHYNVTFESEENNFTKISILLPDLSSQKDVT